MKAIGNFLANNLQNINQKTTNFNRKTNFFISTQQINKQIRFSHSISTNKTHYWDFTRFLPNNNSKKSEKKITSIIVNYKVPSYIESIWKESNPRICCDGGVFRLFSAHPSLLLSDPPTKVIGDLDSITPELTTLLKQLNIPIIHNPDQNSNDLEKSLEDYQENYKEFSQQVIGVIGGLGGNLSQVFANIQSLFLYEKFEIYLLSEENISILLREGKNEILLEENLPCSFVPINQIVFATSNLDQLSYPLQNTKLKFGELISTSNKTTKNKLTIEVSAPCLFTVDL